VSHVNKSMKWCKYWCERMQIFTWKAAYIYVKECKYWSNSMFKGFISSIKFLLTLNHQELTVRKNEQKRDWIEINDRGFYFLWLRTKRIMLKEENILYLVDFSTSIRRPLKNNKYMIYLRVKYVFGSYKYTNFLF